MGKSLQNLLNCVVRFLVLGQLFITTKAQRLALAQGSHPWLSGLALAGITAQHKAWFCTVLRLQTNKFPSLIL